MACSIARIRGQDEPQFLKLVMSRKAMRSSVFVLLALYGLSGCKVGTFEDVSGRPDVAPLRGAKFSLSNNLVAVGVTLDQNYMGAVDVIYLVPLPGFSGPEVKAKETIAAGTAVTVDGALAPRGIRPGGKPYFVISGIQCRFCAETKVLVRASRIHGRPSLPDYFVAD